MFSEDYFSLVCKSCDYNIRDDFNLHNIVRINDTEFKIRREVKEQCDGCRRVLTELLTEGKDFTLAKCADIMTRTDKLLEHKLDLVAYWSITQYVTDRKKQEEIRDRLVPESSRKDNDRSNLEY